MGTTIGARFGTPATLAAVLSALAEACAPSPGTARNSCTEYVQPELGLMRGGVSEATVDLDCNGIMDTVFVERVPDGADAGLPRVAVSLNGRLISLTLVSDGLPKVVGAGDLDGDGIIDLLLATADESISIWPTVVRVTRDSLSLPLGVAAMGVYQFDPIQNPDCDYRSLLPTLERSGDGRLLISWIEASASRASGTSCRDPSRKHWEIVGHEVRELN